jgi:type II secretory pathway pseudopilin PulG
MRAKAIPGKVRSGFPSGIAFKQKTIPGKAWPREGGAASGFPSGIAFKQKAIPGKARPREGGTASGFPSGIAFKQKVIPGKAWPPEGGAASPFPSAFRQRASERGFTLVEALVALFIIIAMTVILYRGLSSGMRVADRAAGTEAALLVAKARLAALGVSTPLIEGEEEGRDGDVTWRTIIQPYRDGAAAEAGPRAYWASVTVSWRQRAGTEPQTLKLTTLKLAPANR